MANNHGYSQVASVAAGTLSSPNVGSSDYEIIHGHRLFDIVHKDRRSIEVIYGNIEESLYLIGMEVHRDKARNPRRA